jgi:2-hydroxycyclohexanecarboxyl-CoA dehydrogenase
METGLKGKSVIVTGGGSNIGKGIVLAFAREGSKIAVADIDEIQAQKAADKAKEMGAEAAIVVKTDVTSVNSVVAMTNAVLNAFGKIDVLVNNVGMPASATFLEESKEMLDKEININLYSTINCTKAVLPHMIQMKNGKIVNIGSEAGRAGDPVRPVYSACKGAVMSLTKAIARDVGRYGIMVNCVCPHVIVPEDPDDVGKESLFHGRNVSQLHIPSEAQKAATAGHALRRVGRPSDIAAAVVFLSSEMASYITGQSLSVNGGDSMI